MVQEVAPVTAWKHAVLETPRLRHVHCALKMPDITVVMVVQASSAASFALSSIDGLLCISMRVDLSDDPSANQRSHCIECLGTADPAMAISHNHL